MSAPAVVTAATAADVRSRRGLVGWYGLWQLRDYLMDRGASTLIVLSLFGYLGIAPGMAMMKMRLERVSANEIAKSGGIDALRAAMRHDVTVGFLANFLGAVVFVGAVFAMQGIVANDRKQGYYRFLFAKPVAPSRFYGQAFLIHWAGFTALVSGMALIFGALVEPVLSVHLVSALAVMFLMYAGIEFLLSSVARWDWMSLVAVTVASSFLWDRYGLSTSIVAKLLYLLPPLHRTSEVYAAVAKGSSLPWHLLGWFGGYGTVCVVAALFVLRYRRLAIV
ncbi:MAG: hypothetical protein ABJE47_04220 [bacterium]